MSAPFVPVEDYREGRDLDAEDRADDLCEQALWRYGRKVPEAVVAERRKAKRHV